MPPIFVLLLLFAIGQGYAAEGTSAPADPEFHVYRNGEGRSFVLIPGGTFQMGPQKPVWYDDPPRHEVTVSAFYLMRTEVTKGAFRPFAKDAGLLGKYPEFDPAATTQDTNWAYARAPNDAYPVCHIDWNDATEYARWLSKREGRTYRLPTESEWEYACRAGTDSVYWWGGDSKFGMTLTGDDLRQIPYGSLSIPGTGPMNPWGLYDILGNAAEWTSDWYRETGYLADQPINPQGPQNGTLKVIRGGAFDMGESASTCFFRAPEAPGMGKAGMRLVCEFEAGNPLPAFQAAVPTLDTAPFAQSASSAKPESVLIAPGVALHLIRIPAGSYRMGSPDAEVGHGRLEQPLTEVTITHEFSIGQYAITQRQYQAVMGANPSRFSGPERPVEQVSFDAARSFCEKLTAQERTAGRLASDEHYRLPTEPEWEYACRAGSATAYPFGDDPADLAAFAWFDRRDGTHEVGQKLPNRWGLYDMNGNVQQWCWGSPCPHPGGTQVDPRRNPSIVWKDHPQDWEIYGPHRSARGGAWNYGAVACRSAMRQGFDWGKSFDFVGFRVVRTGIADGIMMHGD
jgi:formylglycine-generating enzyme required for sulfatase activity